MDTDHQSTASPCRVCGVAPVLTTEELGKLLKCSPTQVRRLNLPGFEVGYGRWRYVTEQVIEELKRRAERGGAMPRRLVP